MAMTVGRDDDMINDQEFLHGAAFLRLIENGDFITIRHLSDLQLSLYLVQSQGCNAAVLMKLSTKPKSPWPFLFTEQEAEAIEELSRQQTGLKIYFALICHKDGICCLSRDRLLNVLDDGSSLARQRISVSRPRSGSYHVVGPERRRLGRTVAQSDWPRILFQNSEE
jgi:hypothetical protein